MKRDLKIFGIGGHNCKSVVEKVEILLDGELDKETECQLIKEINKCPSCLEHYAIDDAFKKFVKNKIDRKNCTKDLKDEILNKIKHIDTESEDAIEP
ncbi:MAG: hypothetical protein KDD32_05825 [Bacteroidetes bacterium]|nr:hypothetical protein [Bacteroidota bacterium]